MTIALGVDTLCWHTRLARGLMTIDEVLEEAAELDARCLQVGLDNVDSLSEADLSALAERAAGLGIALRASGRSLGSPARGETVRQGVERLKQALPRTAALESSWLRVSSGFYRADLAGSPDLIERERLHVIEVLGAAAELAAELNIRLLLENHSDFDTKEFTSIIEEVGSDRVAIFLDMINAISTFEDPAPVIRELAPLADAGHVKDYRLHSLMVPDGHHRRGFEVQWVYPGEGAAPLDQLVRMLAEAVGDREYFLTIEGLDNTDVSDQVERIGNSLDLLRSALDSKRMIGSP